MNVTNILAALLAVAVVATGAAVAAPGGAPTDGPPAQAEDSDAPPVGDHGANATAPPMTDGSAHESVGARAADNAADNGSEAAPDRRGPPGDADQRGPPESLPDQVPDFVGDVHGLIGQHVDGALDGLLGPQVSDVTPTDGNETATPESGNETATPADGDETTSEGSTETGA